MKTWKRKIFLGAGAIVLLTATGTAAYAAVSGHHMSAATTANEQCQSSGRSIAVNWANPFYDPDSKTYVVDRLNLDNIDKACEGLSVSITILDASDSVLAETTGVITRSSFSAEFEPVGAEVIDDVAIVIFDRAGSSLAVEI